MGRRRWSYPWVVLAALTTAAATGCTSVRDDPTGIGATAAPATTAPASERPTTTARRAPTTTSSPTTTTATSAATTTTVLPPVSAQDREESAAALAEPAAAAWLTKAAAVGPATSCADVERMAPRMSDEIAQLLISIPDATLQELALNLDASAGAAAALCTSADTTKALAEWADAVATAEWLDKRVKELR